MKHQAWITAWLWLRRLLSLALLFPLFALPAAPAAADATQSLIITRYASDGTTVLETLTVDYEWLEDMQPVQGNGLTHYWHQGPSFDPANLWDPGEVENLKDKGALKGTDLKDLCELVGGMQDGEEVEVRSADGFSKTFDYYDVYHPEPAQGKMVICWWRDGKYVPDFEDGMQLIFFAQTTNASGKYVFGNWDMHQTMPEERWHFYAQGGVDYPSSHGYTAKWVEEINIYTDVPVYELTVSVAGGGSTTPAAGTYAYVADSLVDLSAVADGGWEFSGWTGNVDDPAADVTTIIMDADQAVTASFTAIVGSYELVMETDGEGRVTPSEGSHIYAAGTVIDLRAVADDGWEFDRWSGDVDDREDETTTITLNANERVIARFVEIEEDGEIAETAEISCSLTVEIKGMGQVTPVDTTFFSYGSVVSLYAAPEEGWEFARWIGDVEEPYSALTTIMLEADSLVYAVFIQPGQDELIPLLSLQPGGVAWGGNSGSHGGSAAAASAFLPPAGLKDEPTPAEAETRRLFTLACIVWGEVACGGLLFILLNNLRFR